MSTGDGEVYTLELVSDRSVTVERGDTQVLTLLYNDYNDLGGAHGSYGYTGYSLDTQTGELLTLDKLSSDPEAAQLLTNYMVTTVENDDALQGENCGLHSQ